MRKNIMCLLLLLLLIGVCGCAKKEEPVPAWQEQYDLGVRYLSEGNYEEAIIAFMAAIEIDPKRPEFYSGLAKAYVGVGDLEKALDILSAGIAETGDRDLEAFLEELQPTSEPETGDPEVQEAETPEPDEAYRSAWDMYQAGVEAFFAGSYEEALELLDKAVSTYQTSSLYHEPNPDEAMDTEQMEGESMWDIVLMAGAAARVCYELGNTDAMLDYFAIAEAHMYIGPPYHNNGVNDEWGGINVAYPVTDEGEYVGVIYQLLGPWEEGNGDPEVLMELYFDEFGELIV